VDGEDRSPAQLDALRKQLASHSHVDAVEVNTRSGSILVLGPDLERLRGALRECLVLVEKGGPDRIPELGLEATVEVVRELDRRLSGITGGRVSIRALVPATFIAMGVRQLIAQGLTLGSVPWYVLIYYGVDSLMKLYPELAPKPRVRGVETGEP
jgi:uncharacterized protein YjhX (UPF0386 family)